MADDYEILAVESRGNEEKVMHTNRKNFVRLLSNNDFDNMGRLVDQSTRMVMFFADWCGHCQTMKPIYASIAQMFAGYDVFSAVNSEKCGGLLDRLGKVKNKMYPIAGYPTLILYKGGIPSVQYTGGPNAERLLGFWQQHTQPQKKRIQQ